MEPHHIDRRFARPTFGAPIASMPLLDSLDVSTSKRPRCSYSSYNNAVNNPMRKATLCKTYWSTDTCRYGDKCMFAHVSQTDDHRLRSVGFGSINTYPNATNENNTPLCKHYLKGRCPYNRCIFLHHRPEEERGVPRGNTSICIDTVCADAKSNPWFKTKMCDKWEQFKYCRYGADCTFAHGLAELRTAAPEFPSRTFTKTASASEVQTRVVTTWLRPRTANKDDILPKARERAAAEMKAPPEVCSYKWKTTRKIDSIYGDWIDNLGPHVYGSAYEPHH